MDHKPGRSNSSGSPQDFLLKQADRISNSQLSIRAKILIAFMLVIVLIGSINVVLVLRAAAYKKQYDSLINNITTANSLNGYVKPAIDTELWNVVKGEIDFSIGKQYQILDEVDHQITMMSIGTDSEEGKQLLEVSRRTMVTLRYYVDMLGAQMAADSKYDDNVKTLDNIRGVSQLVQETLQEYMLFEVNRTGVKYQETQASFAQWVLSSVVILIIVIIFAILTAWVISESIYIPIKKLHDVTKTITNEDLQVLMTGSHVDEITELGMSFNIMIGKVRQLLDEKIKEQENLKKSEMRVLQAQINPHFLYNTLDTIIWLAESKKTEQVVDLVRALSRFFRVTLSKGKDWISIKEEIDHVQSYLTIQKVRYNDILDYEIDIDDSIKRGTILKLSLQPLVENALYHGIKNKRSGGKITIHGELDESGQVVFTVQDNGIGIEYNRLAQIQTALASGQYEDEIGENGYGIYNVDRRIRLYYGDRYGVRIESIYESGTSVQLTLPFRDTVVMT